MPKSKHRKGQKQKAKQRTARLKNQQQKQMEQYFNMLKQAQESEKQPDVTPPPNPYDLSSK